jgi:hypothetical protein
MSDGLRRSPRPHKPTSRYTAALHDGVSDDELDPPVIIDDSDKSEEYFADNADSSSVRSDDEPSTDDEARPAKRPKSGQTSITISAFNLCL